MPHDPGRRRGAVRRRRHPSPPAPGPPPPPGPSGSCSSTSAGRPATTAWSTNPAPATTSSTTPSAGSPGSSPHIVTLNEVCAGQFDRLQSLLGHGPWHRPGATRSTTSSSTGGISRTRRAGRSGRASPTTTCWWARRPDP